MPYSKLHYDGSPCKSCGGTLRYKSSRQCVPCHCSRHKTLTEANRQVKNRTDRIAHFKRRYGITFKQRNQILLEQGGYCAIEGCQAHEEDNKPLYIDHCHTTGQVRGMLCAKHNTQMATLDAEDFAAIQEYWKTA